MRIHHAGFGGSVVYASCEHPGRDRPVMLWHAGSPQTGEVIAPVRDAAASAGMDALSIARPGYSGYPRRIGRTVGSITEDVRGVLDALAIDRVVTVGASGGGPHAVACAAILPDRVAAVVTLASPAPYVDDGRWFDGMVDASSLRAGAAGVGAREALLATDEFNPESFTERDYETLRTSWIALNADVDAADEQGPWGLVDDDVALTHDWGVELAAVRAPVLVLHGDADRVIPFRHALRLVERMPNATLIPRDGDGHISVLEGLPAALARSH